MAGVTRPTTHDAGARARGLEKPRDEGWSSGCEAMRTLGKLERVGVGRNSPHSTLDFCRLKVTSGSAKKGSPKALTSIARTAAKIAIGNSAARQTFPDQPSPSHDEQGRLW